MCKILFVYPNKEAYPIIPLGISILSSIVKHNGHTTDLFDVTFMMPEKLDHKARERTGVVKKVNVEKYWGTTQNINIPQAFAEKIRNFDPDLISFSIVENNYSLAKELFKVTKDTSNAPIIVGGILPTIEPKFFINDNNVDIICVGEGEYSLPKLADKIDKNEDFSNISNLIVKQGNKITTNKFAPYYDWKPFLYQDWEIFDERHLLKPFMGKMHRTGFFEMSRGCPHQCAFCANPVYQKIFKSLGKYRREKPIEYVIKEISYLKDKYNLELIFFNDENFLMMNDKRFNEFCTSYKKHIDLPFFIQTRAETLLNENIIQTLKDINCITIGIGVETGNYHTRKNLLKKNTKNSVYVKAIDNCNKYNIRTSSSIMIGLPFENEEDILSTVKFCKEINTTAIILSIFAPFHGTKLREICIENNFIKDTYNENISLNYESTLSMPQISNDKLKELYYNINNLIYNEENK